ncbi:hypothetical protein ACJIZ3_003764 [Penstemon smallii]|uniref:Glutaredoxin domain-containing protein n=1 Tax=Penstemon smallii TaxID=265156 RepID=A0ABD3S047_9LAMI
MGCASSTLLNQDEEFSQIGGFSHHIVSLTSTTYGLLTLDPPSPPTIPPPLGSLSLSLSLRYQQPLETINSWDLMSGIDSSDHFPKLTNSPPLVLNNENVFDRFEIICPPNGGENKVVMYSTTLRGVRKTFEDCNAVRSAIEAHGIFICERDISMDRGFRDELKEMMMGKGKDELMPPRLFVKGRYIGGVDEVMRIVEEGYIGELLQGLPKVKEGYVCEGCGGGRFLPCFTCNGSCKIVMEGNNKNRNAVPVPVPVPVVRRCSDCNENGLVLCPICT